MFYIRHVLITGMLDTMDIAYKKTLGSRKYLLITRAETSIRNVTNEPFSKRTNIRIFVRLE